MKEWPFHELSYDNLPYQETDRLNPRRTQSPLVLEAHLARSTSNRSLTASSNTDTANTFRVRGPSESVRGIHRLTSKHTPHIRL
jgi:hypothetical protein